MNDFQVINHNQKHSNTSMHSQKLAHCPTPDSMLSTGSASVYSNLMGRSNSAFMLPEKLQIVKPLEGSQTLQHWQNLGKPNLGCLFEKRPGISIKGNSPDETIKRQTIKEKRVIQETNFYQEEEEDDDDGVNLDMYEEEEDEDVDLNFFSTKEIPTYQVCALMKIFITYVTTSLNVIIREL